MIYLVRHGETEWNKKGIIMGQLDSPLTEEGLTQVNTTAEELKNISFDAIFSSDLFRAFRTAEIIKLERELVIQTSKALRERTFGSWEGKLGADHRKEFKEVLEKMHDLSEEQQKAFKFSHDDESDDNVISRFITALREIAVAYANKKVLVVTHGGCIRTFLIHLGYATYGDLPVGSFSNAGYVKLFSDGIDFEIDKVVGIKK